MIATAGDFIEQGLWADSQQRMYVLAGDMLPIWRTKGCKWWIPPSHTHITTPKNEENSAEFIEHVFSRHVTVPCLFRHSHFVGLFSKDTVCIGVARIGQETQLIRVATVSFVHLLSCALLVWWTHAPSRVVLFAAGQQIVLIRSLRYKEDLL